jgi:hypothetical protein
MKGLEISKKANEIRKSFISMIVKAKGRHIACSLSEFFGGNITSMVGRIGKGNAVLL